MRGSPNPPARTLRVYMEVFTGFTNVHCTDGLNTTSLGQLLETEKSGRIYIPRTGEGLKNLRLPGASSRVNWQTYPLEDLPSNHTLEGLNGRHVFLTFWRLEVHGQVLSQDLFPRVLTWPSWEHTHTHKALYL